MTFSVRQHGRWRSAAGAFLRSARSRIGKGRRIGTMRARSSLFWALTNLAALNIGLLYLLEKRPALRDPLYHERIDLLQQHVAGAGEARPQLVVMIGTSRTGNTFNARQMQEELRAQLKRPAVAFNFGIANTGPIMQHVYLRRLLERGLKPDVLILEILPTFYIEEGGAARERVLLDVTRVALDELAPFADDGLSLEAHRARRNELLLNPWGELRFQMLHRVRPSWVPANIVLNWNMGSDPWGWRPTFIDEMPPDVYVLMLQRAIDEHARFMKTARIDHSTLKPLLRTLELCRSEGIAVLLVHLPEDGNFRAWYTPQSKRMLEETFSGLAHEHGAAWVDATAWVADGSFFDGHHLLKRGAVLFTDRLTYEFVKPLLHSRGSAAIKPIGTFTPKQ